MVTLVIDEVGNAVFLKNHGAEMFCSIGTVRTQRASWVVPCNPFLNIFFRSIRRMVKDESRVAAWTRMWPCLWCAEIIGGPVLHAGGTTRAKAIEAEVRYLNKKFLEGVC